MGHSAENLPRLDPERKLGMYILLLRAYDESGHGRRGPELGEEGLEDESNRVYATWFTE